MILLLTAVLSVGAMIVNHLVEQLRRYKLKGEATSTAAAADLLTQRDDCLYHVNFGWPCFALSLRSLDLHPESIHLHPTDRITIFSMASALRWEFLAARGTLLRLLCFFHLFPPPLLKSVTEHALCFDDNRRTRELVTVSISPRSSAEGRTLPC